MADPFSLLGFPISFEVDPSAVERAYLAKIALAHPDRAGDGSAASASDLSDARATLADPERRAGALLKLLGGPGPSEEKSLPDGFLMEIMQLRQDIEDELANGGEEARERWSVFAEERRASHIDAVSRLFRSAVSPDPADPDLLREIRVELNAWRYTERLIEQLDPGYDPAQADFSG